MILSSLSQALALQAIVLSSTCQEKISAYLHLLRKWNRVFNLTAIDRLDEMITLHIIDSLLISPYLHGLRIADVGTGAGLPGIPLALVHPDRFFCLIDSNSKKTRFLNQVVIELALKNVEVVHTRSEDFHPPLHFDSIVSRAFASLADMLVITEHLCNKKGQFLAMKGMYPKDELSPLPKNFVLLGVHPLTIKQYQTNRHLVRIGKIDHG